MITPLLFLLLQSSFSAEKWTWLSLLPSAASEKECADEVIDFVQNKCEHNSELYGGPEACKDIFNSKVEFTCSRNDNPNTDELLSKIDKSVEVLMIRINLEQNVTFNFAKLPSKMKVFITHENYHGSSESNILDSIKTIYAMEHNNINLWSKLNTNKRVKFNLDNIYLTRINGKHDDKLASLYVESSLFEIVESQLNVDVFAVRHFGSLYENTKFKIRAKQANLCIVDLGNVDDGTSDDGSGSGKLLAESDTYSSYDHYEYETLMFYDDSFYVDERVKKHVHFEGNYVSFEFGSEKYEINSTFIGRHSISNYLSKHIGYTTGAQKIILVANSLSKIPDTFFLDLRHYNPAFVPIDKIDPFIYFFRAGEIEDDSIELLEEYKIVITKAGDWTGLKKPKITIKMTNDKIKLDTTDIKDIAEINIITSEDENKKKGLETKYIIIIVVCCVVVVAVVVVVVVVVVLKKKKTKVNNISASP